MPFQLVWFAEPASIASGMLNAPAHTVIASKRRRAVELKDATA
jgi:hypothetical protein